MSSFLDPLIRLFTTREPLSDEQQNKFSRLVSDQAKAYMETNNFSKDEVQKVEDLSEFLEDAFNVSMKAVKKKSS